MEYTNDINIRKEIDSISINDLTPINSLDLSNRNTKDIKLESIFLNEEMEEKIDKESIYYYQSSDKSYLFYYWDKNKNILLPYYFKYWNEPISNVNLYANGTSVVVARNLLNTKDMMKIYRNLPFTLQLNCFSKIYNDIKFKNKDFANYILKDYLDQLFLYPYFKLSMLPKWIIELLDESYADNIKEIFDKNYDIGEIYTIYFKDGSKSFSFEDEKHALKYLFNMHKEDGMVYKEGMNNILFAKYTDEGYIFLTK